MFDAFTDRARKAMSLARAEAQRLNHEYIGSEHVLLGLIREESGIAARVLTRILNVDLDRARAEAETFIPRGPATTHGGPLPFSPRAKRVVELAQREATSLGHDYIGTEHLLLGLLCQRRGLGLAILEALGQNRTRIRNEILKVLCVLCDELPCTSLEDDPMDEEVVATACPAWPFGVDADADEALSFALTHARYIQATSVEPLHILLGLLRESCLPVRVALHNLGIDAGAWRARFDSYRRGSATGSSRAIPLSPPAIRMMEHAESHARRRAPHRFGACEFFLGLIDWSPQLFAWLLERSGVPLTGLRHEVLDLAGADACQVAPELLHAPFAADLALEALSPQAREALDIAAQEARSRSASAVGPEHLLLALARPAAGGAAAILEMMGAFPQDVRAKVEARIGPAGTPAASAPGMSPEVEWVLGVAHNEAQRLGQGQVGTEVLLMGVLWLRRSAAADALVDSDAPAAGAWLRGRGLTPGAVAAGLSTLVAGAVVHES